MLHLNTVNEANGQNSGGKIHFYQESGQQIECFEVPSDLYVAKYCFLCVDSKYISQYSAYGNNSTLYLNYDGVLWG